MKTFISIISLATAFAMCSPASADDTHKHKHHHHRDRVSEEDIDDGEVIETVPAAYETVTVRDDSRAEVRYERSEDCNACKTTCKTCEYQSNDKFVLAGMATERVCNDCD